MQRNSYLENIVFLDFEIKDLISGCWLMMVDGGSLSSPHSGNKIQFITHPHVIIIYPPPHHNQQHHFTSQSRYWFAFTVTGYLQCKYAHDFRANAGTGRNREHISADEPMKTNLDLELPKLIIKLHNFLPTIFCF